MSGGTAESRQGANDAYDILKQNANTFGDAMANFGNNGGPDSSGRYQVGGKAAYDAFNSLPKYSIGTPDEIKQFLASGASKGLSPGELAALQGPLAQTADGKIMTIGKGGQASFVDLTGTLAAFNGWKTSNAKTAADAQQYQAKALNQPGRDATILVGQPKPTTILDSQYAGPGQSTVILGGSAGRMNRQNI